MNAPSLIRRIHLTCAFLLLGFVLMYFISGHVLSHGSWFGEATEQTVRRTEPFPAGVSAQPNAAAFASTLRENLGLRGKASTVQHRRDGTWRVTYFHPGHLTEVTVAADLASVTVEEKQFGWQRVLIGLHRLHGYGGGTFYDVWAFLFDLVSASMIVFAVTGVLLWHRMTRDRRPGWIVLATGFALTASTLTFLLVRR